MQTVGLKSKVHALIVIPRLRFSFLLKEFSKIIYQLNKYDNHNQQSGLKKLVQDI